MVELLLGKMGLFLCILMVELARTFQVKRVDGVSEKKKKKSLYFDQLVHWTN